MNYYKRLSKLKFLLNYLDIIVFFIIIFFKNNYFIKSISPIYYNKKLISNVNLMFLIILILISLLMKSKFRLWYFYIVDMLLSLLYISDLVYYKSKGDLVSIVSIKNGTFFKLMSTSTFSSLQFKDYLLIGDIILLIPLIILLHKRIVLKNVAIHYILKVLLIILFIGINVKVNLPHIKSLNGEQPGLLKNMSNKIYIARTLGILNFHIVDGYNYYIRNKSNNILSYDKDEIKEFFNKNNIPKKNEFTGIGKNKNLIIIQIESLQNFLIGKKINGQEVTPNLNKFITKSMYFNNCFYQVMEGNTSDAEFLCNNSLYPSSDGSTYYRYAGNKFNSLPNLLNKKGYTSSVFHGNNEGFWNRQTMYTSEGFDTFYGIHNLNSEKQLGMGISDESFLNQAFDKIKCSKKPFYSFIITLTSHFPFTDVEKVFPTGNLEGTFMGNYINSIHYTDIQLGKFLDKLEKEHILDDSIVVMYGDHNGVTPNEENELYKLENLTYLDGYTEFMYRQIPLIIHFPKDMHKGEKSNFVGQIDIYPTICNMFELKNPYTFGKDMLDKDVRTNKVLFNNGSFIYNDKLYISYLNKYYDINTKKEIPATKGLLSLKEQFQKEIQYSQVLLQQDLIKNFQ